VPNQLRTATGEHEDLVRVYLKEVGRHALLGAEDEVSLAKAIEAGVKASCRLDARPQLSERGRAQALRRIREGEQARSVFVQANLRLVVSIARRYQGFGLPLLDLIQEGNIGLMRAIEKFDWRRGFKFSTYASWWIRQAVTRGLADSSRTIRAPVHVVEELHRLRKTTEELRDRLGHEPNDRELAAEMGVDLDRLYEYKRMSIEPLSLHAPLGEDGDREFHELIEDEFSIGPMDEAVRSVESDEMRATLAAMSPRERRILELRFGFVDGNPKTLEEIGREFGLTRERIRQLENKAIAKLRHPAARNVLSGLNAQD
jgi:RNA polymerase primary sigma factor